MITEVRFRNFKALHDVTVKLSRLTVFVGPNASGKTSILEGIRYAVESVSQDPPSAIFSGQSAPEVVNGRDPRETIRLEFRYGVARFSIEVWADVAADNPDREQLLSDGWRFITPDNGRNWAFVKQRKSRPFEGDNEWHDWHDDARDNRTTELLSSVGDAALLRLEPSRLANASYLEDKFPHVRPTGGGLATALLYLKANNDDEFAKIENLLHNLVPSVRRIRFAKAKVFRKEVDYLEREGKRIPVPSEREYTGDVLEFDTASGDRIPASQMSEGTLLLLGLLTVLHSPQQPRIILIDDLDRALHPKAQRTLVDLLHQWLDAHPDLQIVATSHSPYLLDALKPEEVRLTSLMDNGDVVCASLEDHPDFAKWSSEMNPGEFWSAVGEDWVRDIQQAEVAP